MAIVFGLCVVASLVWVFANDYIWKILNNVQEKEVKASYTQRVFTYIAGNVIYGINTIFTKISGLLSLQVRIV